MSLQRKVIAPPLPGLDAKRNFNQQASVVVRGGAFLFVSGLTAVDPLTGGRNHGPIAEQVRTTLNNVKHMLESTGSSLERVVRVHVVLADIADMDRVYREFFPVNPPARTACSMQLRFGNGCEIECVALVD